MAELEKIILEGRLEQGPDPDAEPRRSPSPDPGDPPFKEESNQSLQQQSLGPALLAPEEADARYSSIWTRQQASHSTGPKGVLADFRASSHDTKFSEAFDKLGVSSEFLDRDEQDQSLAGEDPEVAAWRSRRLEELKSSRMGAQREADEDESRFGHLREIDVNHFEHAVLDEQPGVKVVLHVFEPVSALD